MIPSKILVYHNPSGGTRTETYRTTRRRKKSHGDLFKNGYRVKTGHGVPEKEEQHTFRQTLASCYRVGSYWGKEHPVCFSVSLPSVTYLQLITSLVFYGGISTVLIFLFFKMVFLGRGKVVACTNNSGPFICLPREISSSNILSPVVSLYMILTFQ